MLNDNQELALEYSATSLVEAIPAHLLEVRNCKGYGREKTTKSIYATPGAFVVKLALARHGYLKRASCRRIGSEWKGSVCMEERKKAG